MERQRNCCHSRCRIQRVKLKPNIHHGVAIAESDVDSCMDHLDTMDNHLWSKLPDNLIELVFARLPWPCILRLRSLNKHWCSFILSENFQSLQHAVPSHRFCLVGINRTGKGLKAWLVDDSAGAVVALYDLPLPDHLSNPVFREDIAVASGGGLFTIFVRGDRKHRDKLLVGNPVRNLWRNLSLPPLLLRLPSYLRCYLRMDANEKRKEYKVDFVIQSTVMTYSSATDLWGAETDLSSRPNDLQQNFFNPRVDSGRREAGTIAFIIYNIQTGDRVSDIRFPIRASENKSISTAWDSSNCKSRQNSTRDICHCKDRRHSTDMAAKGLRDVRPVMGHWRSANFGVMAKADLHEFELRKVLSCEDDGGRKNLILLGGLRLVLDISHVVALQQLLMVYDTASQAWCPLPKVADSLDFFCINRSDDGCMFVPSLTAIP